MPRVKFLAAAAAFAVTLGAMPLAAQTYEVIGGMRQIGANDTRASGSVTWRPAGMTADGFQLRLSVLGSASTMFGADVRQSGGALTGGYSWSVGPGASFALMAGPAYVRRTLDGNVGIDSMGVLASAEFSGFIGERGFAVAYAEYSSPDQAFFARGFYSYYASDRFGFGPDITYLAEPDFSRLTLGARGSYVMGSTVLSATLGQAITDNDFVGETNRSAFVELQISASF